MFGKKGILLVLVAGFIFFASSAVESKTRVEEYLQVYQDSCDKLLDNLLEITRLGSKKDSNYQKACTNWKNSKQSLEAAKKVIQDEIRLSPSETLSVLQKFLDTKAGRSSWVSFSGLMDFNKKILEQPNADSLTRGVSDSSATGGGNDLSWLKSFAASRNQALAAPLIVPFPNSSPVDQDNKEFEDNRAFEDFKQGKTKTAILTNAQAWDIYNLGKAGKLPPGKYKFTPVKQTP